MGRRVLAHTPHKPFFFPPSGNPGGGGGGDGDTLGGRPRRFFAGGVSSGGEVCSRKRSPRTHTGSGVVGAVLRGRPRLRGGVSGPRLLSATDSSSVSVASRRRSLIVRIGIVLVDFDEYEAYVT